MSVFNPNDYINNNVSTEILNQVEENFLRSNGLTNSTATTSFLSTVNLTADTNISGNIIAATKTITPTELSQLDGINTNQTIQQQINGIGGGGSALLTSNNTWSGTQTWNNNFIVNGSTLTPTELSYIDGATSNLQNQITANVNNTSTNTNNIGTINTTLSNNGITNSTNVINTLDYLQSQISNLPNGSGSGANYFLTNTTSTINNQYKTISIIPANSTNQILTTGVITSSSGNVLMGQFISDPLNITSIPSGIYDFNFYANLTNNNLSSYLIVEFYKYSSTGTTTLLFTATGGDINSAVIIPYNINLTVVAQSLLVTDSIMIRIYGATTSSQNITINVDYNSSNNYSHFHIPTIQRQNHNDLLNIQGGATNDYQHLTTSQLNNIVNPSSISQNGYLTNSDWTTFNNKQNNIVATSINDYYRGDKTFQPLNKSAVGLANVDNTSDLNKPISTAIQTALNAKQNTITTGTTSQYIKGDLSLGTLDKAAVGLSNVVNKDFTQNRNNIIYVDGFSGLDSNDGLSLLTAYKTINAALTNGLISSGVQVVVYPSTYTENIIINSNNTSIVGTNGEIGGIINIAGNITITSSNTSIRLCSLTFNNFTMSGTSSNVYLKDCNINGNITKSGSGFLSVNNITCSLTTNISISGSGNCNFFNNCSLGLSFLVNSSGAIINTYNCLQMANIQVLAGICSINNVVVYATNSAVNAVSSSVGSIVYLSNLSLVNGNDNSPGKVNLLGFWSINNVNFNKSTSTLSINNLQRDYTFDKVNITNGLNIVGNINNTTPTQLSYLDATSSIQTQLNNTITADSVQTLSNKTMTGMKLTNNQLKTSLNRTVTFIDDLGDVIIGNNINSATQTMHNKLIYDSQISNTSIGGDCLTATQSPGDASNKLASTNFVQEAVNNLTNKNLTNCTATTVTTSDVSTKIATTAFIDNKLSSPNTYVATSLATFSTQNLTSSYQDILTITIPVAGTYEIIMNIIGSADQQQTISNILFNSTTSTEVANSLFTIQTPNLGIRSTTNISKSIILQNITANTVLKVRSKQSGGTCYIYNDATNGYTFISYRMLGLVANNVITTNTFGVIGTLPLTLVFNDYTMLYESATTLKIKKTSATTLTWGGSLSYSTNTPYYSSNNLIANTYSNIYFTGSSYPSVVGMTLNGAMTDETNTYNIQVICITASKFSISIQKVI
jgi:hypothetical protein